jgi:hypothetical protein
MNEPRRILVVANETVGSTGLIDAVKRHADTGEISVHVVCPQNAPKHGYVIYDGTIREAAENRLALTLAQLREIGIEATGEVMDPDPYSAIMDAVGESHYDEIIVSTHPETRSGWLRQDLISRVAKGSDIPVEHVVVDLDADRELGKRTLVVANQTVGGEALIRQLEEIAEEEGAHKFVVICPANEGDEEAASERLAHTLTRLEHEGLQAVGQVAHGDPYTAIQNALQFYPADEIVISTFPETRSGWLRSDLIKRVQSATSKPVHHVVVEDEG